MLKNFCSNFMTKRLQLIQSIGPGMSFYMNCKQVFTYFNLLAEISFRWPGICLFFKTSTLIYFNSKRMWVSKRDYREIGCVFFLQNLSNHWVINIRTFNIAQPSNLLGSRGGHDGVSKYLHSQWRTEKLQLMDHCCWFTIATHAAETTANLTRYSIMLSTSLNPGKVDRKMGENKMELDYT